MESERKYWAVVNIPMFGGAFVSHYRLTDEEIKKIMDMNQAFHIDLSKEFGYECYMNLIDGVIRTNDKDRAKAIAQCLNDGGTYADVLEV